MASLRNRARGRYAQIAYGIAALGFRGSGQQWRHFRGFRIYCTPCHSELGNGHGMVVQRNFSPPPDYTLPGVKNAPTAHYYDVTTNGFGMMYSFAQRIPPR